VCGRIGSHACTCVGCLCGVCGAHIHRVAVEYDPSLGQDIAMVGAKGRDYLPTFSYQSGAALYFWLCVVGGLVWRDVIPLANACMVCGVSAHG